MVKPAISQVVTYVLFIVSIVDLIAPTISSNDSLSSTLFALAHPEFSVAYAHRLAMAFILFGTSYAVYADKRYRKIPITNIRTDIGIIMKNKDGSEAESTRVQFLRANQGNVRAFIIHHKPNSENGQIDIENIHFDVTCNLRNLKGRLHLDTLSHTELMYVLDQPLPYAWWMRLVPLYILRNSDARALPRIFRKYVIVRRSTVPYKNEYNQPRPILTISAGSIPQNDVRITIQFDPGSMPDPATFSAMRIKSNAVTDIDPEFNTNEGAVMYSCNRLVSEKLRITWQNDPVLPDFIRAPRIRVPDPIFPSSSKSH